MKTVSIIGIGRAGGALAIALERAGVSIVQLVYRSQFPGLPGVDVSTIRIDSLKAIDADIALICTQDPQIRPAAVHVAELERIPKVALHLSGSLSSSELDPLKSMGVAVGSMHPLASISDAQIGAERFMGAYFCVEGDPTAVDAANEIVHALGGIPFTIDTGFKPLYHAAAVMASGHINALFDQAIEILSKCGLDRQAAHAILFPLLQSSAANLAAQSTAGALTGPFVRGDVDAFRRHLASFEGVVSRDIREVYLLLAERSVEIARRSSPANVSELAEVISMAKRKTEC